MLDLRIQSATYPTRAGETGVVDNTYPVGDIRRYGALPGAGNDCTTAINNAVLSVNALGGGDVIVPSAGTAGAYWRITDVVTLRSNVRIAGSGVAGEIRQEGVDKQTFLGVGATGAYLENVVLENVAARGVGNWSTSTNNDASKDRGVEIQLGNHVTITGCSFRNYALAGIWLAGVKTFSVRDNVIVGTAATVAMPPKSAHQYAIVTTTGAETEGGGIRTSDDGIIRGNDVSGTAFGINVGNGVRMVIDGNHVHDIPGQHGMYLAASRLVVSGNVVDRFTSIGIKVDTSTVGVAQSDVSVTGNVITASSADNVGILVAKRAETPVTNVVISNNSIRSTPGQGQSGLARGIDVSGVAGAVVSGNMIRGVYQHGILLNSSDAVEDLLVEGNLIVAPGQYGILCQSTLTRVTIAGNRISQGTAQGHGIYVAAGSDVVIRGNDVRGGFSYGIANASATGVRVVENTIGGAVQALYQGTAFAANRDNEVF